MIDVAGQRSLRKKWIHFFTEVTAVSFFVSLTAVDEILEEDPTMNSLQDSLQAFNEVSHNQFLEKTDFILFLNKKDLFANKLKSTSLSVCFPEYQGSQDMDSCLNYIRDQFANNKPKNKQMYWHNCCAINVPMMKELLGCVVDLIIDINIRKSSHI
ncbi:unnamed protein product [Candidula unifasciata]|uniref:Uncharacterized protein n=1 Tax=Candidula unifasciata TaxID=100452 RepID=A0A8S3ZQQ5_9EUPU|nr:unnamed protein product [Candidula unifasciata]